MKKQLAIFLFILVILAIQAPGSDYPVKPVPFTNVQISDHFWLPRLETNRTVTIPFAFKKCAETGRIDNFAKAAGLLKGEHIGQRYNDSDVFKVIEGASYSLTIKKDPKLEKYLDGLIAKIAAAQEKDGYLYTARTINPEKPVPGTGEKRWSNLGVSHELYNMGHMYEAAIAHYQATGKRSFLDVALKNADLVDSVFGPGKSSGAPGHQEIEIGLARLYRVTGEEKYLKLAKFFLDQRGKAHKFKVYPKSSRFAVYNDPVHLQYHKPVVEQEEAVGHAVRAAYMYSAMADVAALTGDKSYIKAINRIWENVVTKKLYLTGGIGSRHEGESFGDNYELPNLTAYNETCAAIANVMWNFRLFLLHGDGKYIDVLERTLYNGLIVGVSKSGDCFFYPNPLESNGQYAFNQGATSRKPWFDCACCPGNLVRFLPSLPGYIYAHRGDTIYVILFVSGKSSIKMGKNRFEIQQKTGYPRDGTVNITVTPEQEEEVTISVRIPGWARNQPVPGNLYRYMNSSKEKAVLKINRQKISLDLVKGFARIRRKWKKGDLISLTLPMPVRRVLCSEKVKGNRGKVALERGPIVYCAEGADNNARVLDLILPDDTPLKSGYREDLLGGINIIKGKLPGQNRELIAIPYYAWSHRGAGEMAVWLKRKSE